MIWDVPVLRFYFNATISQYQRSDAIHNCEQCVQYAPQERG